MIWIMCLAYFHKVALNYQQSVSLKHEQEMQQMNEFMLEIIGTDESKGGGDYLRNIPSVEWEVVFIWTLQFVHACQNSKLKKKQEWWVW